MGFLEKTCEFLERYITKITKRPDSDGAISTTHLEPLKCHVFNDARSEVEQLIEEALRDRISEFLELSNYDWELSQSSGVSSDYITDLINFLSTTFQSFTNLPPVLARHVCLQV